MARWRCRTLYLLRVWIIQREKGKHEKPFLKYHGWLPWPWPRVHGALFVWPFPNTCQDRKPCSDHHHCRRWQFVDGRQTDEFEPIVLKPQGDEGNTRIERYH